MVVLSVGTNNIPNTCDEILEGIESIAWTISNALPNTKIIALVSLWNSHIAINALKLSERHFGLLFLLFYLFFVVSLNIC